MWRGKTDANNHMPPIKIWNVSLHEFEEEKNPPSTLVLGKYVDYRADGWK